MNGEGYIYVKQTSWASEHGIELIGSKGVRGRPAYTTELNDNLFEPLEEEVRHEFEKGDGGELKGNPSRMQAVHSSSALAVNVFQYWKRIAAAPEIAAASGFCNASNKSAIGIRFEQKFQINPMFDRSPNIDVTIQTTEGSPYEVYAIECKFGEPYSSRGHGGLDPKYLDLQEVWKDVPNIRKLARRISPSDPIFKYLHAAQLVKHILGLKVNHGKRRFRLLYLWYDCLGQDGAAHRIEAEQFTEVAKSDGVNFHQLSYQDLMARLIQYESTNHRPYVQYIINRYL
jgi:hypothetical protein